MRFTTAPLLEHAQRGRCHCSTTVHDERHESTTWYSLSCQLVSSRTNGVWRIIMNWDGTLSCYRASRVACEWPDWFLKSIHTRLYRQDLLTLLLLDFLLYLPDYWFFFVLLLLLLHYHNKTIPFIYLPFHYLWFMPQGSGTIQYLISLRVLPWYILPTWYFDRAAPLSTSLNMINKEPDNFVMPSKQATKLKTENFHHQKRSTGKWLNIWPSNVSRLTTMRNRSSWNFDKERRVVVESPSCPLCPHLMVPLWQEFNLFWWMAIAYTKGRLKWNSSRIHNP